MPDINPDWVDPTTGEPAWWPKVMNRPARPKSAPVHTTKGETNILWLLAVVALGVATVILAAMYLRAKDEAAVLRIERDLYQCQLTWGADDPYCTAKHDEAMQRLESNRL